jgi:hypothetical protein
VIRVEVHQKDQGLAQVGDKITTRVARVVFDCSALLLSQIRRNASTGYHAPGEPHIPGTGPGPNVATGDYRRSWRVQTGYDAHGNPQALVSTNAPQGARLEYGYTGTDTRGRSYNQPPYPHVRPAVEQYQPVLADMVRTAMRDTAKEAQ